MTATLSLRSTSSPRLWLPEQVLFTPAALDEPFGQEILERVQRLNLPIQKLPSNRITGIRGNNERETYSRAKRTLAVVSAPPAA
jgi:spore photoproduct lyase